MEFKITIRSETPIPKNTTMDTITLNTKYRPIDIDWSDMRRVDTNLQLFALPYVNSFIAKNMKLDNVCCDNLGINNVKNIITQYINSTTGTLSDTFEDVPDIEIVSIEVIN